MQIVMLLYPRLTQLDLTGPFEVLSRFRECKIDLVWKTTEPVRDASGLTILPSCDFRNCPQADILFVPGQRADDPAKLRFPELSAGRYPLRSRPAG